MTEVTDAPPASLLRGTDLLDAAIERIGQYPETWNQAVWRCGTVMCLAGHITDIAGGRWTSIGGMSGISALIPETYDPPRSLLRFWDGTIAVMPGDRARRLLGFDYVGREYLFAGGHSFAALKRLADLARAFPGYCNTEEGQS